LDISSFLIELSGFLKELQCTFDVLVGDTNINNRMQTVESRYILLEFLIADLMTQKMLIMKHRSKDKGNVITIHESPTAAALKDIAITLNLGKPPENISAEALFQKINSQYDETIKNIPKGEQRIGHPLFNPKNALTNDQWVKVEKIQAALEDEYNTRRKMLMTRLDVTISSFKWSDKLKGKEREINEKFSNKQQLLEKINRGDHRTDIVALLAARDKLAIIEKTSSANVRKNTQTKLQRHIIGKVPDRGGRTLEHQKPPPEMPVSFHATMYHNLLKLSISSLGKRDSQATEDEEVVAGASEVGEEEIEGVDFTISNSNNSRAILRMSTNRDLNTSQLTSKVLHPITNIMEIVSNNSSMAATIKVSREIRIEAVEVGCREAGIIEVSHMIAIIAVEDVDDAKLFLCQANFLFVDTTYTTVH
jgi:hypothetical protein